MLKRGFVIFLVVLIVLIPLAEAKTVYPYSSKQVSIPEDKITHKEALIEENQQANLINPSSTGNNYFYLGNQLLAKESNGNYEYYVHDQLGSIVYALDEQGNIKEKLNYEPFGAKKEGNTGLYYYGARYYDSELGRFITTDPMREGHSPYVYVGNNPLNLVDPSGESPLQFLFGALGLIGGSMVA